MTTAAAFFTAGIGLGLLVVVHATLERILERLGEANVYLARLTALATAAERRQAHFDHQLAELEREDPRP